MRGCLAGGGDSGVVVRVDAGIGRAAGDGGAAARMTREEVRALLRVR